MNYKSWLLYNIKKYNTFKVFIGETCSVFYIGKNQKNDLIQHNYLYHLCKGGTVEYKIYLYLLA